MAGNINGMYNKKTSLDFIVNKLNPSVIILQETKLKRKSQVVLCGYRLFCLIKSPSSGGLLIACKPSLKPVLVFEGSDECQVIVIQVQLQFLNARIIAGYGPQESDKRASESYRECIEEQIIRAYISGCEVLLQEDSNAKLGNVWIPGDKHLISHNGKLLQGMLLRQGLFLENSSSKCTGGP